MDQPFNVRAVWDELEAWECRLTPPDRMHGPRFGFCQLPNDQWAATHWAPFSGDIVWTCEGENPNTVMAAFREHLRGLRVPAKEAA